MRKSYLLLLFFIVNIYTTELAKVCQDGGNPTNCEQEDCTEGTQTLLQQPTGATNVQCYTPREHCTTYDATEDECATCENNYELYDDSDVMKCRAANCLSLNEDVTKCDTCQPSFTKSGYLCTCSETPVLATDETTMICPYAANCVEYDNTGKCTKCEANHYLEADGTPTPVVADKQKCTPCPNGETSDGTGTTCSPRVIPYRCHNTAIPTTEVSCDDASVTDLGVQCPGTNINPPTEVLYGTPKKCYIKVDECEIYNPSYDACYKCPEGKVLSSDNKKCVTKINGCKTHSSTGTCSLCYDNSDSPSGSTCACTNGQFDDEKKICKKIANCDGYDSNGKCTKCQNGYNLNGNPGTTCTQCTTQGQTSLGGTTCFTPKTNCAEHDVSGNCKKCNTDYYVKSDGSCDACTSGSGVKGGSYCHNTGFNLIDNCIEYSGVGGVCTKCDDYIAFDNDDAGGGCKTAGKECYYPEVSDGVHCYVPIDNCEEYGVNNDYSKCKLCKSGYYTLIDGTCVEKPTGGNGGNNNNNGGGAGTNTNTTPSNNPDGSDGNMMRLNIIYMAIMLMIIV